MRYLTTVLAMSSAAAVVFGLYGVSWLCAVARHPLRTAPFVAGVAPDEHAMSRYHARWYNEESQLAGSTATGSSQLTV